MTSPFPVFPTGRLTLPRTLPAAFCCLALADAAIIDTDVCVYGGPAGGVTAAVQVTRMGKSVALLNFNNHLGGLSSSGLGATDIGNFGNDYIQGLSREFYVRVGAKYGASGARFQFEPKRAEQVFNEMAADAGVPVYHFSRIESVVMDGRRIVSITMDNGNVFRAKMFIDASYEGDLLKKAGVTYTVGREANALYGETINGIQRSTSGHQFDRDVDPYIIPGNPASGLLPMINPNPAGANGTADGLIQAYCFRMCLTDAPANRKMIGKPAGYNEQDYELFFRWLAAGTTRTRFYKLDGMPNNKTDSNNDGPISCDYIGGNNNYVEADHATREQVVKEHEKWQRGLVWTIQNHERVPQAIRDANAAWGLPLDEFPDNDHWPYQLYIREARRMISDYVMTQKHCTGAEVAPDSIGLAAYTMDSHNVQRYVNASGKVRNEGDVQIGVTGPYPISYRAIVPKAGECTNLLVPWCLSASHVSFGSFRMEPVFMMTGQSAATAACFAIDDNVPVQEVPYPKLRAQLLADKMKLNVVTAESASGIVVDNADATGVTTTGEWLTSSVTGGAYGGSYLHDNNAAKGTKSVRFTPTLPDSGNYQVFLRWTENANRATNVPVDVRSPAGTTTVAPLINQKTNGGQWVPIGTYNFNAGTSTTNGSVTIRTTGTLIDASNGYVIADAVRFLYLDGTPPVPDIKVSLWGGNTTTAEPHGPGAPAGKIMLNRTESTALPLTVQLTISGTATSGADYTALPATATFPAGSSVISIPVTPLADALAEGTETLGVAVAAGAGYQPDTIVNSATVAIHDRPFDAWRHSKFTTTQLVEPAASGDLADPDGDGLNNLLEYLSAKDPGEPDPPVIGTHGVMEIGGLKYQTLTFERVISSDVTCIPEVCGELVDWQSGPAAVEQTVLADDGRLQTIRARDLTPDTGSSGKRFIRLRVNREN